MMQLQNGRDSILLEGFLGDSEVKNLPVTQETWVRSLGWEDSLEEEMATHLYSILAWEIPWTERSLMGYSPWGHKESTRRSD